MDKIEENNTIPILLEYAFPTDFENILISDFEAKIIFKNGYNWKNLYFTPLTFKLFTGSKNGFYGAEINSGFEFSFGGENVELFKSLFSFLNTKLIFRITYIDGQKKLLGTKQKPCLISLSSENQINSITKFTAETNDFLRFISSQDQETSIQQWILSYGFWSDLGVWSDSEFWIDTNQVLKSIFSKSIFQTGYWSDSGVWSDTSFWID